VWLLCFYPLGVLKHSPDLLAMADKLGEGWEYRKEGKKEGEEREGR